jgi:beta-N-acetylhexosaminidase
MAADILGVGLTGPVLTELEREILRKTPPYAIVLFGRNITGVQQLQELCEEIKRISPKPPVLMIDEEGGRVDRLRNLIPGFPSAAAFMEGDEPERLAGWSGRLIGRALRFFDIDLNLSPVVDVERETPVKGLERRCFGRDPETVIRLAGEFMRKHQQEGSAVCLKHFPGIGAGSGDPHYGATVVPIEEQELVAIDLAPYIALAAEAECVMIGHGTYPQLDSERPASLSRKITHDLLRHTVNFNGLIVSDDMEMHAVSDLGSFEDISEAALMAGNDAVLYCSQIEAMPELVAKLSERATRSDVLRQRMDDARMRCEKFRAHIDRLRATSVPVAQSFNEIVDEQIEFCELVDKTRHAEKLIPESDRRNNLRSPGTGKTGREEWT